MKQPRLLILGASNAQLPIISKALKLGCHVITLDNIPDNIGHQFSQQSVNCSTVDLLGVLQLAKQLDIDGIVTFASDIATNTVAFVAAQLGLQACPLEIAETLSNKAHFRVFQHQHLLERPWFFIAQTLSDLEHHYPRLLAPLIFKPVDTSGSRGISKLDKLSLDDCHNAFALAQSFSRSHAVSVEEFIEGTDVSGDGFLIKGQLHAVISQKYTRGFIPVGHYFPSNTSAEDQQRIFSEIEKTCHALSYLNGPIDFDVKISSQRVVVIEMSPRLGGNGIPELIYCSTGIDLIAMNIHYALAIADSAPKSQEPAKHCASWVFGSETAGKLKHITPLEKLKNLFPALIECRYNYQIGDNIPAFEHSGNSLGFMLFNCSPECDYQAMSRQLQAALQLSIQPDM